MVRQAAERLHADNIWHALLDQLDHFGGQQPALAHLDTLANDFVRQQQGDICNL